MIGLSARRSAKAIQKGFTSEQRERFRNLLTLAAESPFAGERTNALAAAERMALRHGMTLDEAATGGAEDRPPARASHSFRAAADAENLRNFAQAAHLMDHFLHSDKARLEAAREAARKRGLGAEEAAAGRRLGGERTTSRRRMDPTRHATVLLRETRLPFREVAEITGLDVYEVVGLKLKLRAA